MIPVCHAGRLQHFYKCWPDVTNNTIILDWVKNGLSIPFNAEVNQVAAPRNTFSDTEKHDMILAIQKLIELGAVVPCEPCEGQYLSKFFLAPKPDGSKRFILNLKLLNKFIPQLHFKMEDYRTAAKLIAKGNYMASIDLKEAYLLLPVNENDRKYLRFQFEDLDSRITTYEFTSMPYGLSVAPRTFTKIMKEVMTYLRSRGFTSVIYLDDILCIGQDYNECLNNVRETIRLLKCLGFIINYKKSNLDPKQSCRYLGFIFNSLDMSIALPEDKRINIARLLQKFQSLPSCTIRDFAHLIGTLTSACPAIKYGWAYTKLLERQKFLALQKYGSYEKKFRPAKEILPDLVWWLKNINTAKNSIGPLSFDLEIFTDASLSGWGAYCNQNRVNGSWKDCEKSFHINYLELMAIFLSLKCFAKHLQNCTILLRVDNTTAISYINRMGGIQFPHLNELAKAIWQWCEKRNIWLFAAYINTKDNVEADEESRRVNPDIEWSLSNEAYLTIQESFGYPQIDLFASRTNAKCETYVSWKQDPDALVVDAFTLNWNRWYFYAFPPFPLILKCLEKILSDRAEGIFVFPYWPSQPWFPLLMRMIKSDILFLDPANALPHSSFRTRRQFSKELAVARLSGLH